MYVPAGPKMERQTESEEEEGGEAVTVMKNRLHTARQAAVSNLDLG